MDLLNIGFGSQIVQSRLIGIATPSSAPMKRTIQVAREKNMLVDATFGRKTRSILLMDNGYVFLSAIHPDTLSARLKAVPDVVGTLDGSLAGL